jgi:fructuronate reductase
LLTAGGPDWQRAGAILTPDVAAFERAKLWLLNGPHSTLAYWGSLKGHETVAQAIGDPELVTFLYAYMHEDIVPLLQAPGMDLHAYADAVIARFHNPAIHHLLAQIAHDGSQKLPVRVVAPMREALARGADVSRFAVPLAAWLRFLRFRHSTNVAIHDPLSRELAELANSMTDIAADVDHLLALRAVISPTLATNARFQSALISAYSRLLGDV